MAASGSNVVGDVNHVQGFRNPVSGYHTNDAESEMARLKFFLRAKYGYVRSSSGSTAAQQDETLLLNISEYAFYTNVGSSMDDLAKAFRRAGSVMSVFKNI